MLEEASLFGNKKATYVMGMLLLAEGSERQPQALQLLNDAYPRSSERSSIIPQVLRKVETMLMVEEDRREIVFHGCSVHCPKHTTGRKDYALFHGHNWLFDCDFCLWAACFMSFARRLGKDYRG